MYVTTHIQETGLEYEYCAAQDMRDDPDGVMGMLRGVALSRAAHASDGRSSSQGTQIVRMLVEREHVYSAKRDSGEVRPQREGMGSAIKGSKDLLQTNAAAQRRLKNALQVCICV